MRINNNVMALNAHRQLGINQTNASKSMERLSSGMRINRAGDDAAGLAISEKMRGQIRGLKQAARNAQDGISLIQTAEGALNEIHAILQRMRELAVQASTDTNTEVDRGEIQKEIDQLAAEITRIADTTEFNTQNLLGGEFKAIFHIGANEGQNITLAINAMDADTLGVGGNEAAVFEQMVYITPGSSPSLSDGEYTVVSVENYKGTALVDDNVKNNVSDVTHVLVGSDGNAVATSEDGGVNWYAYAASDRDSFVFSGAVEEGETITIAGTTATANVAISNDDHKLDAGTYTITALTYHATLSEYGWGLSDSDGNIVAVANDATLANVTEWQDVNDTSNVLLAHTANEAFAEGDQIVVTGTGIDVSTQEAADAAITTINEAIETVSAERSKLGAYQNRLEHTISNLNNSAENLQAAESRIRDLDMAEEIMAFTKNNILQQAATAMLAQANMAPQSVLQLLG